MGSIFKLLENSIEKVDTTVLEKHLNPDIELNGNGHPKHFREIFKSLKSIEIKNPLADIFATQEKVVDHFRNIAPDLNDNREVVDINAVSKVENHKTLRWWEITHPEWQPM